MFQFKIFSNFQVFLFLNLAIFSNSSTSYFSEIEKCKITSHGSEYIGKVDKTFSGKQCINWTTGLLQRLYLDEKQFLDLDIASPYNYCRNPNQYPKGPWCVTDEKTLQWEQCNIPLCIKDNNWCKDTESGFEYFGNLNLTKSGNVCKFWSSQNNYDPNKFPEKSVQGAQNYCRNPAEYSKGPWCYVNDDNIRWEECDVPQCETRLSQIEYFGGYDFLKTLRSNLRIIRLENVIRNITFVLVIPLNKWSFNVKSKTSLWSTDYEPSCQTDFNEYEFCILFKLTQLKSKVMLIYKCNRPLKNLIIITPILRTEYEFEYRLGEVYKIKNDLNSNFKEYQDKVDRHLKMYQTNNISMPTCSNFGSFLILKDNSFPYAITSNNDVIFVVSDIGKGRVGFIACDGITDDYGPFKDFLRTIYGEYYVNAVILTENIIQMLHDDIVKGKQITIQLIWNAHYEIKESSVKQLLDLIKYGLKIVIGLKPWAYNNYLKKLEESELLMLFKAAGIWPSLKALNVNLTRTNRDKIAAFSLNHQLGYAKTSLENLKAISESIVNIVINSPFQIIGTKSEFLEVTKSIQEILQMYSPYVKSMIPCLKNIVKEKTMKDLIYVYNALLIYPFNEPTVAPGVSFYPGKFQSDNFQPLTIEMYLYLKFKDEIFQLGLYLPPGKSATVQLKSSRSQTCVLHLNFHLFDVYFKDEYYKWPTSKKSILLNINTVETFSFSFGGLLSISCASDNNVVDIVFSGVIQVPVYDRRDPDNNKNWMILQKSKAPWAILAGDSFVFVVSINTVRNLAQPNKVLELFDLMVNEQHHLRGLSVEGKPRETISTDIQIELGYMHSGYPIGTMIQHVTNPSEKSKFLFDFDNIRIEGRWGVLHEIGHNLQDSSFTFTGTVDVTNNIFTLIGVESATGKSSWSNNEGWASDRSYIERFVSYLKKGNFNEWKNEPFLALGVYAQLRSNFEWELYYQVFRQYNTIAESIKRMSDTEKIQQWIILTSIHAKMNLCPLYDFWRWPVDPKTNQQLLKYPYFFPDDFLTNLVPEAVDNIIIKYGGSLNVKRLPVKLEEKIGPLKGKTSVKGDKIIEKIMILN